MKSKKLLRVALRGLGHCLIQQTTTLTSAVLDRLLHHAETITLEGRSYRMKDQIEEP